MIRTYEDLQRVDTEILERYFRDYQFIKNYVESATDADKHTPLFKQRKIIVEGIEKIYPTFTEEMKVIIHHRYWFKDYQSDWAEIADELGMTVSRVKRIRDVIIHLFSEAIGWV